MSTEENKLKQMEDVLENEQDTNEIPPIDIVAFNELRSCADLYRMYSSGQLKIQPDFQREIVWLPPAQTRFIDSLTKQLPIPSMCFSYDYKTDKRMVIDGLQRMQSIINFLHNDEWKLSELSDVDELLSGKTVHTIKTKSKILFERVQNVVIPITVIRCDTSKQSHSEYLYTIFHRLNSGGAKLNNQEIRNCVYSGGFNDSLRDLSKEQVVVKLLGKKPRFSSAEMILRFYAFYDNHESYTGGLSKYLNDYMFKNRYLEQTDISIKKQLFVESVLMVTKGLGSSRKLPLGKTVTEGLLLGTAKNLNFLQALSDEELGKIYDKFLSLAEFSVANLQEGLSDKSKVIDRINVAIKHFSHKI